MPFNPALEAVDHVLLAGRRSPGIAEIKGAASPRLWDKRRGYGNSGSTLVFRGIDLSRFTLYLRLYKSEDWEAWHEWSPLVQRPPTDRRTSGSTTVSTGIAEQRSSSGAGGRGALDIWHPILEDLGIRSVVVEDVLQPQQTADGEWTIEIRLIEWRRPRPALARPQGSEERPPATDPVDVYIEELSQQVQALASE